MKSSRKLVVETSMSGVDRKETQRENGALNDGNGMLREEGGR